MNRDLARPLCALLIAAPLVACGGGDGGGGDPLADPVAMSAAPNSSAALEAMKSAQPDECATDQ